VNVNFASPEGYEAEAEVIEKAQALGSTTGAKIQVMSDPRAAVEGAVGVYTDVWTSMGWERETQERRIAFAKYQVNADLMALAAPNAIFMHCLPALRGEEVTDQVIESEQSAVFDQAENRLHAQKALLMSLLAG
jgi:ornithine carbamoyltransferase